LLKASATKFRTHCPFSHKNLSKFERFNVLRRPQPFYLQTGKRYSDQEIMLGKTLPA
jgi:hypothetical protein